MAEIIVNKSEKVKMTIALNEEETQAFMKLLNTLTLSDGVISRCTDDVYPILNDVWWKGFRAMKEVFSEEDRDIYFNV